MRAAVNDQSDFARGFVLGAFLSLFAWCALFAWLDVGMIAPAARRRARPIVPVTAKSRHLVRREGDERACSCGARWPAEEEHP